MNALLLSTLAILLHYSQPKEMVVDLDDAKFNSIELVYLNLGEVSSTTKNSNKLKSTVDITPSTLSINVSGNYKNVAVSINGVDGETIFQKREMSNNFSGSNTFFLNKSEIKAGIYNVMIISGEESIIHKIQIR